MKLTWSQIIFDQWTTVPPVVKADLSSKTVIVLGANVGLGFEAAKHFARMSPGKLILACRSEEKGEAARAKIVEETGCETAEVWVIDLANFASVISFAERFENEGGRLDILLENAAVASLTDEFTKDNWEESTQVNNLSTSLLALLLLPRLLETAQRYNTSPRLVVVTSGLHFLATFQKGLIDAPNFFRAFAHKETSIPLLGSRYSQTKLLNVFFIRALNDRLHRKPIIVDTVNPGFCYSSLRRSFTGMRAWSSWFMEKVVARTAEQGSRQLVWAAIGNEEKKDELRGEYISLAQAQVCESSDYVTSEEGRAVQDKLWDNLVEELVKIEPKIQQIVKDCLTAPTKS